MVVAITREVSASLARCELTHLAREPINVERAQRQHGAYEAALRELGVEIVRAREELEMPDAVFVEDTAVVVEEGAVMMRPGAESRRGEVAGVAEVLGRYRQLAWIQEPGTVDGGDVLRVGNRTYVGKTSRTNAAGIEQLHLLLGRWGYEVIGVEVRGCLHLKSAATLVGPRLLLINPMWVDRRVFADVDFVETAPGEDYGANGLLVNGHVLYGTQYPQTREHLERHGVKVVSVDGSELAKAEGAVTCCCILVPETLTEARST